MLELIAEYKDLLINNTIATIIMVVLSTLFSYVLGLPLGIAVVITKERSIAPNRTVYSVLEWIINIGRSIPFIILMVTLIPLTRTIMGTAIGIKGATLPLVIAAAPFVARMVETSLEEAGGGIIEAAQSTGANVMQIVFKVLLPESLPSIIRGVSITFITLFGYVAMAGAIGAGGLGDVAIRYGYYRGESELMYVTLVILIILVQLIQSFGNFVAKRVDKRTRK